MDKITLFYVILLSMMVIFHVCYFQKVSKKKPDIKNTKVIADKTCSAISCADTGSQVRVVKCYNPLTNKPLPFESCSNLNQPPTFRSCANQNCVDWTTGAWSSNCNMCRQQTEPPSETKTITRNVSCPSSDASNCDQLPYNPRTNPRGKPIESMVCSDNVCSALSGHYIINAPPDDDPFQGFSNVSGNIRNVRIFNDAIIIPNGLIGNFMISIVWYGGISSQKLTNVPPVKYSNILPLNYFGAGTKSVFQNSSIDSTDLRSYQATNLFFLMTFSIIDFGSMSKIMFDGKFSLPTSTNSADLFIVKLNDNVNLLCNPCVSQIGNLPLLAYHQLLTPTIDDLFGGRKLIFDSIGISTSFAQNNDGGVTVQPLIIPYSSSTFLLVVEWSGTYSRDRITIDTATFEGINVMSYFNRGELYSATNAREYSDVFLYMIIFTLVGPMDGKINFAEYIPENSVGDIFLIELDSSLTS